MTSSTRGKRYGVVSVDQQRTMSGLEFVQGLVTGALPLNSMAETLAHGTTTCLIFEYQSA